MKLTAVALVACTLAATGMSRPALAHGGEHESAATTTAALGDEARAVVAVLNAYTEAVEHNDMAAIERLVVDDDGFSSFEGTYADWGWASYRDHLGPEMAMFRNTRYHFSNMHPYVSGDMAYVPMDYSLSLTIESDQFEGGRHDISMKGKATFILTRAEDGWKIRHMHTVQQRKPRPGNDSAH